MEAVGDEAVSAVPPPVVARWRRVKSAVSVGDVSASLKVEKLYGLFTWKNKALDSGHNKQPKRAELTIVVVGPECAIA